MAIEIPIRVDSKPVRDAKQQIDLMNRSLRETQGMDEITIGDQQTAARVRQIAEQVRRLQTLSKQGANQGGILDKKQFAEAAALMKTITSGTQGYFKQLQNVRAEIGKIVAEQRQLASTGQRKSDAFTSNKSVLADLQRERLQLENHERHLRRAGGAGTAASEAIGAMGERSSGGGGAGFLGMVGKGLKFGLAAAGIGLGAGALLSFFGKSRSTYEQAVGHESTLYARGIGGFHGGMRAGVGPLEYMGLMDSMSQSTGITGGQASSAAMQTAAFGKRFGVDLGSLAGLRSTLYQATGDNNNVANGVIVAMAQATTKGLQAAKLPELLTLVGRNTGATASAMNGAGMSKGQAATATNMAIQSMLASKESYGVYAKSGEFMNVMQNGLKGAGTPAGEILLHEALGGFNGPMTYSKVHEMNMLKQGGFLQRPDLLKNIIGRMGSGDPNSRAGMLETMFSEWGITGKSSEHLINMHDSGFLDRLKGSGKTLDQMAKGGDKEAQKWLKELNNNPANEKERRVAEWQSRYLEMGDAMNKAMAGLDRAVLNLAGKMLKSETFERLVNAAERLANTLPSLVEKITNPGKAFEEYKNKNGGYLGVVKKGFDFFNPIGRAGDGFERAWNWNYAGKKGWSTGEIRKSVNDWFVPEAGAATIPTGTTSGGQVDFGAAMRSRQGSGIDNIISNAARRYGVSEALIRSVIKQESGGNRFAKSRAGAMGLMQLMPGTARMLDVTDPFDAEQNVNGGTKYLRDQLNRYNGDVPKALAAYNWGPGNVDKKGMSNLPKETRDYIKAVTSGAGADFAPQESTEVAFSGQSDSSQEIIRLLRLLVMNTTKTSALSVGAS